MSFYTCVSVYIYMCVCVCVCVYMQYMNLGLLMENMFFMTHQSWAKYPYPFSLLRILTQDYSKSTSYYDASSLGSIKSSSIWILNYLWKQCFFFFFLMSSFTLKSRRIPNEIFSHNYEILIIIMVSNYFLSSAMQCASIQNHCSYWNK